MKRFWFIILIILTLTELRSENVTPKKEDDQHNYQQLFLGLGYPFIVHSKDFLNDFHDYLGASKSTFSASNLFHLRYKLRPIGLFRIGVELSYFNLLLSDSYQLEAFIGNALHKRDFTQEIKINNIPAFVTLDFVPYQRPYKSYIGLGLGICYSETKWIEYFSSTYKYDDYEPGEHINKSETLPCIKLYTGVELSFDETLDFTFLGSLCFELSYTFYSGTTKFFENTAQQNYTSPVDLDREYTLFPSSLNLSMLVSFNMSEKIFTRNRNK